MIAHCRLCGVDIARSHRFIDGAMRGPGPPAHVNRKVVRDALDMDINEWPEEIDQHRILRSFGHREMEFPVEILALVIVGRERIGAVEHVANGSNVFSCGTFGCEAYNLTFQQTSCLPKVADANSPRRHSEQRSIVDQRHPAKRTDHRAAAMRRSDDVQGFQALDRLAHDGEADTHRAGEVSLRGESVSGLETIVSNPLHDQLGDLIRKRLRNWLGPNLRHGQTCASVREFGTLVNDLTLQVRMKITGVRCIPVLARRRRAFGGITRTALGPAAFSDYAIVFVDTDAGITGLGEVDSVFKRRGSLLHGDVERALAPAVIGENPLRIAHLVAKMDQVLDGSEEAKAGIEMALWDIKGKALDTPVYNLLGGKVRERIPLSYSIPFGEPDAMADFAQEKVKLGHRTIKVKVGSEDSARDIAAVKAVRKAIGPDIKLRVDGNMGWRTPKQAARIIRQMEERSEERRVGKECRSRWSPYH